MRKLLKLLLAATCIYLILAVIAGAVVGEGSLKLVHRPVAHRAEAAAQVRDRYHVELQEVSVTAADAIALKGWYIHPKDFNGNAVVLLHGITDNREGMAGFAKLFLDHGYAVLLPDARAHGESGGEFATYGLKEADDVHRWVSWIYSHDAPQCVYGLGESYGAALLLQALADEPRFCAAVVESPFSTARDMSYERVSGPFHVGPWFGQTLGRPVIASAVAYARLRYGIDLLQPSPLAGIRNSHVPVLLIHGETDQSISPRHSIILAAAAPDHAQLWLVPNAGHTMAWAAGHQEFEARVLGWFAQHTRGNIRMISRTEP